MSSEPSQKAIFPFCRSILRFVLSLTKGVIRFIFSGKMAGLLLVLVTIVAIAWQIENWRGRALWNKTRAEILAKGDSLDWRTFVPDAVADEDNAAMHPVFDKTIVPLEINRENGGYPFRRDFKPLAVELFDDLPDELIEADSSRGLDYWHSVLTDSDGSEDQASNMLAVTHKAGLGINLLSEAFSRPHCHWFPLHQQRDERLQDRPIGQTSYSTGLSLTLIPTAFLRATAHLEIGNQDDALREVLATVRFCMSNCEDPSLIGSLLSIATVGQLREQLPALLINPRWRESDLATIAQCLDSCMLLDQLDRCLRMNRAGIVHYLTAITDGQHWAEEGLFQGHVGGGGEIAKRRKRLKNWFLPRISHYMPRGWHYQNIDTAVRFWDQNMLAPYDQETKRLAPELTRYSTKWKDRITPYNLIAALALPSMANLHRKAALHQGHIDLCRVLCGIERYRRVNGEPPTDLEELIPDILPKLPHDYVSGLPPYYEVGANDRVSLATLDWDRTGEPKSFLCQIP